MRNPLTVIHLFARLKTGGATSLFSSMVPHFDHAEHRHVVCSLSTPRSYEEKIRRAGCRIIDLGHTRDTPILKTVWLLARVMRAEEVDVLHTNLRFDRQIGQLASLFCNIATVTTLHGAPPSKTRAPTIRRVLDRSVVIPTIDRFVAVSRSAEDQWSARYGLTSGRIEVVHNGIPLERFSSPPSREQLEEKMSALGISGRKPVLINVGRLDGAKAQARLVPLMKRVVADYPEAVMLIVGEGGERKRLEHLISRHAVCNSIKLLGMRQDVDDLLHMADLFVSPSKWETFGIAVLEAMAAGLPVVASKVGGIPEIVRDGKDGLLVPPDDAAALLESTRSVLSSPEHAELLGGSAKKRASQFSVRSTARSLENLYESAE